MLYLVKWFIWNLEFVLVGGLAAVTRILAAVPGMLTTVIRILPTVTSMLSTVIRILPTVLRVLTTVIRILPMDFCSNGRLSRYKHSGHDWV